MWSVIEMKRAIKFVFSLCLLILCLCGCGILSPDVETLKGWSFQYNEETQDYSLFFGLCNRNENYVSADATVSIRIENDNGEIVYTGTKNITKDDFGSYSSQIAGERFLANVRINASEIQDGVSSNGTVYFTVSSGNAFSFDECNCKALYCLPVKGIRVTVSPLPIELQQRGYDGSISSKLNITDVQYTIDSRSGLSSGTFTISGEKTYGSSSAFNYDIISYKLYDHEGYLTNSGQVYIGTSLSVGDKFKDSSLVIYDLTPGEDYSLQLLDYGW